MKKISDPGAYLERQRHAVEKFLAGLFDAGGAPSSLQEAMRYSVNAGGKRMRPLLVMAAAETLGHPGEKLLPVAAALELVHTYSLIHDDLPAMDDSDLRRGSRHATVLTEAMAIPGRGCAVNPGFRAGRRYGLREAARRRLCRSRWKLARAAGREGWLGGRSLILKRKEKPSTWKGLKKSIA